MKKWLSATLALMMILSLVSCGEQPIYTGNNSVDTSNLTPVTVANIPEKDPNTSDMPTFYGIQFSEITDQDRDAFTNAYNGQMVRIAFVNFSNKIDSNSHLSYLDNDSGIKVYVDREYYDDFSWDDGGWVIEGIVSSNEPSLVVINDADILFDTGGHWWEDDAYNEDYSSYDDDGNLIIDLRLSNSLELLQKHVGESVRITDFDGYKIIDESTNTIKVGINGGIGITVKLLDQTQLYNIKLYRGYDIIGNIEDKDSEIIMTRGIIDSSNVGESSMAFAIDAANLNDNYYGKEITVSNITCMDIDYEKNYLSDVSAWLYVRFANYDDIFDITRGDIITVSGVLTKEDFGLWSIVDASLISIDGGLNLWDTMKPSGPLYGPSKPDAEESEVFRNSELVAFDDLYLNDKGAANYDYNGKNVRLEDVVVESTYYNSDGSMDCDISVFFISPVGTMLNIHINNAKEKINNGDHINIYGTLHIEPNDLGYENDIITIDNGGVYY